MSHKYSSDWAKYLHGLSMEMWQADELGDTESFGWYAFFPAEQTILGIDSDGFVSDRRFETRRECRKAWRQVERDWSEFENEDDETFMDDDDDREYA